MFTSAGFENKESLNYEDFKTMMKEFKGDFLAIGLDCKGAKQNYLDSTTNVARMQSFGLGKLNITWNHFLYPLETIFWLFIYFFILLDAIAERRKPTLMKKWDAFTNYLEENRQHIFYIFIFYVITIALFIERFIFYAFLAEHLDLR